MPPEIGRPGPNHRFHVHAGGNLTSLGLFYDPLLPEVDTWFRDFHEILVGMKHRVEKHGSKFLVVLFPTRFQIDHRDWRLLTKFYALDDSRFDLGYPNQRIQQFCRQNHIHCLDLLPEFKSNVLKNGERLYMGRGDMHFNARGQSLAARILGEHIDALWYGRASATP